MRLMTMTQGTFGGGMRGNDGTSDRDRKSGFEGGRWAMEAGDNETATPINEIYKRADAFMFGWRTYENLAGSWGSDQQVRAA